MRFPIQLMAAILFSASCLAQAPLWPLPGTHFEDKRPYAEFVQPTAAGTTESALFGCVRNDGSRFHEAIDLAPVLPRKSGRTTDPVKAIYGGRVAHINRISGNSSYGRYVVVEHIGLEPAVYSLYAHLASIPDSLQAGDSVEAGDELGILGRSAGGYSIPRSRAHLHLEVGLRLSDDFESWYQRNRYSSPNLHGNYNGMNLIGLDPLDFYTAFRDGRVTTILEYLEQLPPALMLHIRTRRYPDFLELYPQLKLDGCSESERAGWEVILSGWGFPLSLRPLREADLRGVRAPGDISIVASNQSEIDAYGCRDLTTDRNGQLFLGSGGRMVLELLFKPD
jgi:murein DD-endopeptidase MepM/ murein hydrolase activator NlpD